jgi:ATP-dependent DNA ligase
MPADPLRSLPKTKAAFVEPMDCLPVAQLPDGSQWVWEIKLDGYRAVAVKSGGAVTLYSRNRKILNKRFPYIVEPLRRLPDETVVDGEIVALDDDGRPVFNLLQNFTSESSRTRYFLFDLLCYKDRDPTRLPLLKRREMLRSLKFDDQRIVIADYIEVSAEQMLAAVREQRLEGVIGKQRDSMYEPGKRSGAWIKHRVNLGQEFVIGGFTPGPHGLDAIIVGYYPRRRSCLCCTDTQWICACVKAARIREVAPSCDARISVRESARDPQGAVGRGFDRREDEEMCLGAA